MLGRTLWFWIVLIAGLGGVGLVVAARMRNGAPATAMARKGPFRVFVAATGRIDPLAEVSLGSKTPGRLATVEVNQGETVRSGQRIATLEVMELMARRTAAEAAQQVAEARSSELEAGTRPEIIDEAKARVEEAEASLSWAERECERWTNVAHEGAASGGTAEEARSKRDAASAALDASRAALALAEAGPRAETRAAAKAEVARAAAEVAYVQALLDSAVITAPFDGLVVKRHLDPGEVVAVERPTPILTLADTREIRVRAEIDETDVRWLALDQPVRITSDALPGEEFEGRVVELGMKMGRKSLRNENPSEMVDARVLEVKITVAKHPHLVLGLMVDIFITVDDRPDVLQVPLRAVTRRNGRATVWARDPSGAFLEKSITCGATDGLNCEVREGLAPGDIVQIGER